MSEVRQVVVCLPGAPYGLGAPKDVNLVLQYQNLAAAGTTGVLDCQPIDLSYGARDLMLTVYIEYHAAAVAGARIHLITASVDIPAYYDTVPWNSWTLAFVAGGSLQQSMNWEDDPAFIRVLVENLDAAQVLPYVDVIATVGW